MANINKIKALAKEKGIKIRYICSQLGLTETYLNNVQNGKDRMRPERLEIIAEILDTTPEYLNDETDSKERIINESDTTWYKIRTDNVKLNIAETIADMSDKDARKLQKLIEVVFSDDE